MNLLSKINSPNDLKKLKREELPELAAEIREGIIHRVDLVGGHLGSNLGVIEATIALHYVFDSPNDKMVFDSSHQCYTHAVLTGRRAFLEEETYKKYKGCMNRSESEHDIFTVGHTATSISLASGLAKARDLKGTKENIIALIGDGSLTGGEAYEGLDYVAEMGTNFIVVANDNEMSIAESHGGIGNNFKKLKETNGEYNDNLFRSIGFDYMYVEEGNNVNALVDAFSKVKDIDHPIVVHIHTKKGLGSFWAVKEKELGHYVYPPNTVFPEGKDIYGYTRDYLFEKAKSDDKVCVINSATPTSLGMDRRWRRRMGKQFVDVAIAEEHAVGMVSGMAKNGAKPVYYVFGTFLQRAFDQLMMDLALNESPAVILVADASIGASNNTHNGTYAGAMLANIPGLTAFAPSYLEDYLEILDWAIDQTDVPVVINMPSEVIHKDDGKAVTPSCELGYQIIEKGNKVAIIGYGSMFSLAKDVFEELKKENISATLIDPIIYSDLDKKVLDEICLDHELIVTIEDTQLNGGYGEKIASYLGVEDIKVKNYGAKKEFLDRELRSNALKKYGMTKEQIFNDVLEILKIK